MIETNDCEDILNVSPNREQPLHLVEKQKIDEIVPKVNSCKHMSNPGKSLNLSVALRKYKKQFDRLIVENVFLYSLFHDNCGKLKNKQFCVTKTLWHEVVFRLFNSKTAA